ncbi:MAG: hypothetical protein E4H20_10355, partial [Spirochaetales bacterium]
MCSASTSTSCSRTSLLLAFLVFSFHAATAVGAQESRISLRASNDATINARIRTVASCMLVIDNDDSISRRFILEAILPDGWRALSARSEVSLAAGSSDLHLVSFVVPMGALAGEYTPRYRLVDAESLQIAAEYAFRVNVLPEYSIEFKILDKPEYVVAGDSYEIDCVLTNTSNEELLVKLVVDGGASYEYRFKGLTGVDETIVPVGAVSQFTIVVATEKTLARFTTHRVQVKAMLRNTDPSLPARTAPLASVSYAVDVLPRSLNSSEIFHTVPAFLQTTAEGRYGETPSGYLSETIGAKGSLDEYGEHLIDLTLKKRISYGADSLLFDPQDRYILKYHGSLGDLTLGDDGYAFSPLVGSGGLGRGGQFTVNLLPVRVGALYYSDIWSGEGGQGLGANADFTVPGSGGWDDYFYRVGFNVLSALDGSVSWGLSQRIKPFANVEGVADLALQNDSSGALSPAVYISTVGEVDAVNWSGRFIRAWPGFEGSFHDTQMLHSLIGLKLLDGSLALNAGFQFSERNLELDEALPSADRTVAGSLGIKTIIPGWETILGIGWETLHRIDRLATPTYDSWDNIFKLELQRAFKLIVASLGNRLEFGNDAVLDSSFFSHQNSLMLEYKSAKPWRYAATAKFGGRIDDGGNNSITSGLSLETVYSNQGTNFGGLFYNTNTFKPLGVTQILLGFTARLSRSFQNGHVLLALADLTLTDTTGVWTQGYTVSLAYRAPLDIPVSRKHDTVIVRGRVYDVTTGRAMSGVLIRLNGLVVVTCAKGEYIFYLPRTSSTYLQVDRGTVPTNMVTMVTMPLE